jgi:hypothetical protein
MSNSSVEDERGCLWKSLWKVCITFCIKPWNTVEGRQKPGEESNFPYRTLKNGGEGRDEILQKVSCLDILQRSGKIT